MNDSDIRGFRGVDGARVREDDEGYFRESDRRREALRAQVHYGALAAQARIEQLERDNARLRAALETIVNNDPVLVSTSGMIAYAALEVRP